MKKHRLLKTIGIIVVLLAVAAGVAAYKMVPPARALYRANASPEIMAERTDAIFEAEHYTALSDLPDIYSRALLSAEDKRFYSHPGFDVLATARAAFNDIRLGRFAEGGSTITQQLAKNLFFTQEKQVNRKIAEVFAAFELESRFTKDEILELYINSIYYGNGYYGIYDAAMGYFGKTPAELSDAECVLLVGIPNAPSAYAPTANPELTLQREQQVLEKMIDNGAITAEAAAEVMACSDECVSAAA